MKKFIGFMGIGGFFLFSLVAMNAAQAETLFEYFRNSGRKFTSCGFERKFLAAEHGVFGYDCSARKNEEFIGHLKADDELLGFSVVTRYRTTLSASLTSSASTINVSSIQTFDNTALTMALLGPAVYLTVDPGNSKEEIVRCTGISGNSFTSCTRGLAFSGTSNAAVANNQKAHTSGAVIIMSNTHYVYEQLVDKDAEQEFVTGTKWFTSNGIVLGDGTTSSKKFFWFCDANTTSTCGYLFAQVSSTANTQQELGFSTDGTSATEFVLNSGGTVFSAGNGLQLIGGVMSARLAATSTGALGLSGNQLLVTTTFPNGFIVNADGLALSTSTPHVWSASTTFGGNANNGVYIQNATTTFATTTILGATTVSSTHLFVSSTNIAPLLIASTSQALNFHYHSSSTIFGILRKAVNVTTADTINHGLGVVPSSIFFFGLSEAIANNFSVTMGYATSTVAAGQRALTGAQSPTEAEAIIQPGQAFAFKDANGTDVEAQGNVSAMTTQTFTITWDSNSVNGGDRLLMWMAIK